MCGRKAPFCRIPMRSRKLSDSEKHSKRSKRRVVWDWLCEGKRGCQRERGRKPAREEVESGEAGTTNMTLSYRGRQLIGATCPVAPVLWSLGTMPSLALAVSILELESAIVHAHSCRCSIYPF